MAVINMAKAINKALFEAMERDERVIVMGEDVGWDEGVFRITEGLHAKFGDQRVIDTPLAESGIVGTAIGMAIYGLRPVCEIQFAGFDYYNYHQLESHAARFRNRTRGRLTVPMVMRAPFDAATIIESVRKTGRCVVVYEGPRTCGLAAEIIARINENVLLYLEAPVRRVTGFDVPVPYFSKERAYLPDADKVVQASRET